MCITMCGTQQQNQCLAAVKSSEIKLCIREIEVIQKFFSFFFNQFDSISCFSS